MTSTPPMGFNDWLNFGCNVTETLMTGVADAFKSKGLKDVGYSYVNIDDCWAAKSRDAAGKLQADSIKFPHGMKWLADYMHTAGLKFGIYSAASESTCAGYPGSAGHYTADMQTFADWGVDYIKLDLCGSEPNTLIRNHCNDIVASQDIKARYAEAQKAIAATGRSMVLGISAPASIAWWCGDNSVSYWDSMDWTPRYGDLWRTAVDAGQNWTSILKTYKTNVRLAGYQSSGHWNDADMLVAGSSGATLTEQQTQFTLWSEMAAPLLISTDLANISSGALGILTNKDVIAVDQDPLGTQGTVVQTGTGYDVLSKPLANGDRAVVLFNKGDTAQTISTTTATIGLSGARDITDLVTKTRNRTSGTISAGVPAHGTVIYRVSEYTDLAKTFNNVGITDSTNYTVGNFDGTGNSYSASALAQAGLQPGASFSTGGLNFSWPAGAAGTVDNVTGNAVFKVSGSGSTLGFLGAGIGSPSGTGTIAYSDGTAQDFTLSFPNWAATTQGDAVVAVKGRNTQSGPANPDYYYRVFYRSVALAAGKQVVSVTLPTTKAIHVFATAIG
ncbi:glycoside hydrolase family 27 protein [Kitasatospora sp. NPDC057015]|uniref:glycoside hydrolase family 27 protein n=1 Tax=Kitasatospora sp. NPDC057015 TaxID=3346001 RepID=UPI00362FFF8E